MPDTATRPTSPGAESLSVFFPCYNEQDNIRRVYESAVKVLGTHRRGLRNHFGG